MELLNYKKFVEKAIFMFNINSVHHYDYLLFHHYYFAQFSCY